MCFIAPGGRKRAGPLASQDRSVIVELAAIAENPAPAGAITGSFSSAGNMLLRYARWRPTLRKRQGTVCLFPGRGEFIEKYLETAADLLRRGFAVAIMDWRGQGGSQRPLPDPRKGHIDDFAKFDADLRRFMSQVVLPDCPAPYFALAHSMGAHILLRAASLRNCWFERMVLCAPMLRFIELPASEKLVERFAEAASFLGFAGAYVPTGARRSAENQPFKNNRLTSDPLRHARNKTVIVEHPQLGLGSPTIGWLHAAFESMHQITTPEFARNLRVPLLVFAAGNDRVVSSQAIQEFAKNARTTKLISLPAARHEILQERDELREQFWAAFDAFVPGGGNLD